MIELNHWIGVVNCSMPSQPTWVAHVATSWLSHAIGLLPTLPPVMNFSLKSYSACLYKHIQLLFGKLIMQSVQVSKNFMWCNCHVPWHHRTYHLTSAIFLHTSAHFRTPLQFFPLLRRFFFLPLLICIPSAILITSKDLWPSGDAYIMFLLYPAPFRTLSDCSIILLSIYILFPSPSCDLCVVYSLVPLLVCFFSLNINYGCPQHFCPLPQLFCPFRSLLHTRNKDPVQSEGATHKLKPCPYPLAPPTPSDHSSHLPPPPKPSTTSLPYSATFYPSRTSPTCRLHAPWQKETNGKLHSYANTGSTNHWSCSSDWQTHRQRFNPWWTRSFIMKSMKIG